jgi:hypothetical protein
MPEQTCVECHRPMTVVDGRWVHQLGESGPCPPAICECGKNIHLVDAIWRHVNTMNRTECAWDGDLEDGAVKVAKPRNPVNPLNPYESGLSQQGFTTTSMFVQAEADPVNHPSHYSSGRFAIECIAFTRHMTFSLGNAFKYVWRWQEKGGVEDLRKALVYLNWAIEDNEPKPADAVFDLVNEHILTAAWDHEVYGALVFIGYGHKHLAAQLITSAITELEQLEA